MKIPKPRRKKEEVRGKAKLVEEGGTQEINRLKRGQRMAEVQKRWCWADRVNFSVREIESSRL